MFYNEYGQTPPERITENGRIIINPGASAEWRIANGYTLTENPIVPPESPARTIFTQRSIRLACRELGFETKLDALLNANETFKRDWIEAQDIDFSFPEVSLALHAAGVTDDEYNALLEKLRA